METVPYEILGTNPTSDWNPPDDPGASSSTAVKLPDVSTPQPEDPISPSTLPLEEELLLDEETDEEDRMEDKTN